MEFDVQTAGYRELQKKGAELKIGKVAGVPTEELRALVAEKLGVAVTPKIEPQTPVVAKTATTPKAEVKAPLQPAQLVYNGMLVASVSNRILSGRVYKDVHLANGETHTLTQDEYAVSVIES